MTKFAKPKARFDKAEANNGVWFYITDENDYEYGGFKCGLFDPNLPRIRILLERMNRQANARAKGKRDAGDDVRAGVESFIEACMFDWDIKDEAGKPVKFTKETAVEYFTASEIDEDTSEKVYIYDYVFAQLMGLVRDVRNFQSEEQEKAGETLGN